MKYLKNKKIIISISVIVLILICFLSYNKFDKEEDIIDNKVLATAEIDNSEELVDSFYVDIKGNVKTPGVYVMNEGDIVNDLVTKAGGFTKNAYTKNINLSKKLSSQMMIYIYSKSEITDKSIKEVVESQDCICNEVECSPCVEKECSIIVNEESNNSTLEETQQEPVILDENKKISLNNATKDELLTLSGIGESKADAIIEYRTINGGFKDITELLKVTGIGESIFAKIKEDITL